MRQVGRWFLGVVLLLVVVAIAWMSPEDFSFGVRMEPSQVVDKDQADQVMHGVHLIETASGTNEWELWAEKALGFKGQGNWQVEDVKVIFYGEDGTQFVTTGDRGFIEVDKKDMLIEGNVVTKTSNDYRFYSEEAIYKSARRELTTDHPVTLHGPKDSSEKRMILKGIGMLAQINQNEVFLNEDVRGEKALESGSVLKIRSERAKVTGLSKQAEFIGDVEMFVDTQTVTGPKAVFKYASDGEELETIEVVGGVKVSDEDKWATSQTLDIIVPQKMYILSGEPLVVQNNDEIEGEQIILLNGGKQVQVFSGKARLKDRQSSH